MSTLAELVPLLSEARQKEANARNVRIQIEMEVANLVETPPNGSKTIEAAPGVKVTVKKPISYKADIDALREYKNAPLKLVPAQPASYKLDEHKYEALKTVDPHTFQIIAQHVTISEGKPQVSVKMA